MKVGVLQFFSWPDRRISIQEIYRRSFERIETMDKTGYDAVWLAEHHFSSFSVCPSVHVMAAQVAARTEKLRVGTGVSLAPFYNPLRLAEEVALVDVLSGGRVNWGVGRGYQRGEFEAFGVDSKKSYGIFREYLKVVLQAWTQEKLEFHGEFVDYDGVEVLPKPLQQPHPPVWLAASSPEAFLWAAQEGFSIMLDPHAPHADIGRKREAYREELERNGHSIEGREIPMARLVAVARTDEEAEAVARRGAEWTVGSHKKKELAGEHFDTAANRKLKRLTMGAHMAGSDAVENYVRERIIWGSPAKVRAEIERLHEEIFLDYLLLAPLSGESFDLFTEEVLPNLPSG